MSISKSGSTQGIETELFDGGGVSITEPVRVSGTLQDWLKSTNSDPVQFPEEIINNITFIKVPGSYNYLTYYTMVGKDVFGISTIVMGPDKRIYQKEITTMLGSLRFTKIGD